MNGHRPGRRERDMMFLAELTELAESFLAIGLARAIETAARDEKLRVAATR